MHFKQSNCAKCQLMGWFKARNEHRTKYS